MSYTAEIKTLTTVYDKLKKRYEKTPNKPLGDVITGLNQLLTNIKSISNEN